MKYQHVICGALLVASQQLPAVSTALAEDWKDSAISPVTNPLFFEDPRITTEIRPIFMEHNIDPSFATKGGDVQVIAAQARWAVTDRFAIIATKDGYVIFNPKAGLSHHTGFADIALGVKYAVVDDVENQLIVTPGFKINVPTGNSRVFQGSGEEDVFVSAAKGFDKLHLTANFGGRIGNDSHNVNSELHYSGQVDYNVCKWFDPFVSANAFTVLTAAKHIGLDTEGYDLINFGSSNASGKTEAALGVGFRSRLTESISFGLAWEKGISSPRGLFDDRYTVDLIWRF